MVLAGSSKGESVGKGEVEWESGEKVGTESPKEVKFSGSFGSEISFEKGSLSEGCSGR